MTLNEITQAMQAYSNLRNSNGTSTMKSLFNNKNAFNYTRDTNNPTDGYVHVYPGVSNNTLVFFVISANKDVSGNSNIENDIQVCASSWVNPGPNTQSTYMTYVQNWINNYDAWIGNNIGTTNSIFQAFALPQVDSSFGNQHIGILGLTQNSNAAGVPADIVVQDSDSSQYVYYDNALPVPPFGGGVSAASAFYLLSLI